MNERKVRIVMVSGRIRIRGFFGVYVSFKSRVTDPGRFYPDPTFGKKIQIRIFIII